MRKFWTWLNTPLGEYKHFKEWQNYIDQRTAGYREALITAHATSLVKTRDQIRDHHPAWKVGFQDGRVKDRSEAEPTRSRSKVEVGHLAPARTEKTRLNGHDLA